MGKSIQMSRGKVVISGLPAVLIVAAILSYFVHGCYVSDVQPASGFRGVVVGYSTSWHEDVMRYHLATADGDTIVRYLNVLLIARAWQGDTLVREPGWLTSAGVRMGPPHRQADRIRAQLKASRSAEPNSEEPTDSGE